MQWFQFCRCMLNMFKIILVSVCLQTSGTTLTWFSSLYQTSYGAVRPDWAKAVYRSQSSTFPWCSRLLGFTFHHCYLRLGHAPGKIDRQRAIGPKCNNFVTESWIYGGVPLQWHDTVTTSRFNWNQIKPYSYVVKINCLLEAGENRAKPECPPCSKEGWNQLWKQNESRKNNIFTRSIFTFTSFFLA